MTTGKVKLGRPFVIEGASTITRITFGVDRETLAALEELERVEPAIRGRRSTVLRRLILEARQKQK